MNARWGPPIGRLAGFALFCLSAHAEPPPAVATPRAVEAEAGVAGTPADAAPVESAALSPGSREILRLKQNGVSTEVMLAYIETPGRSYSLEADEIVALHRSGIPGPVIVAMIQRAPKAVPPAAPARPAPKALLKARGVPAAPQAAALPAEPLPAAVGYTSQQAAPVYYYPYEAPSYYYPSYSYYGYSSWPVFYSGFYYGSGCWPRYGYSGACYPYRGYANHGSYHGGSYGGYHGGYRGGYGHGGPSPGHGGPGYGGHSGYGGAPRTGGGVSYASRGGGGGGGLRMGGGFGGGGARGGGGGMGGGRGGGGGGGGGGRR